MLRRRATLTGTDRFACPLRICPLHSIAIPIDCGYSRPGNGTRRSAVLNRSQLLDGSMLYQIGLHVDYPETIP